MYLFVFLVDILLKALFVGRLTWLVYIIGSAIGGRVSFNSNDEHDAMDGELVCR
jgi:exportin-7